MQMDIKNNYVTIQLRAVFQVRLMNKSVATLLQTSDITKNVK